jgi:hypothetical protein
LAEAEARVDQVYLRWHQSHGLEPVRVGSLPVSVAMLTGLRAQIEMMAVDGCQKGDGELVYRAIAPRFKKVNL